MNALAPTTVKRPAAPVRVASVPKRTNRAHEEMSEEPQLRLSVDQIQRADDLVTAVLFLVSDAAADVTGNLVTVG